MRGIRFSDCSCQICPQQSVYEEEKRGNTVILPILPDFISEAA
jgi:hypothetical protein